jgi:hypothetical protein
MSRTPRRIRQLLLCMVSIAIFGYVLVSCTKPKTTEVAITVEPKAEPVLQVKDGVIAFETSEDFSKTMAYYHTRPVEELRNAVKALNGFNALTEVRGIEKGKDATTIETFGTDDSTPPEEEIFYEDSLVQDPYVQSIMNAQRETSIEGIIIRVTDKGVFAYMPTFRLNFETNYATPQFDNSLAGVFTNSDNDAEQDLQEIMPNIYLLYKEPAEPNTPTVESSPAGCNGTSLGTNWFGQISDCTSDIDSRRRIRYTTYAQNLGFYSSIGFNTRRQTRFLGVWFLANAQNLSCEGEGSYESKWPSNILTTVKYDRRSTRKTESNRKKAETVLAWHTAQLGVKTKGPKSQPVIKFAKKYKYKKHVSDHTARNNNVNYAAKMVHY